MINIMIVEDEKPSIRQVRNELLKLGINPEAIYEASNGISALEIAENHRVDILLTDINMPRMLGTELAQKLTALYPRCKVIFFSGYSDKEYLKTAIKLNVVDYLEKPLDPEELKLAVDKATGMVVQDRQSVFISRADEDNKNKLMDILLKNHPVSEELLRCMGLNPRGSVKCIVALMVPGGEYYKFAMDILLERSEKYGVKLLHRYAKRGIIELLFIDENSNIKHKFDRIMNDFFAGLNESDAFKCGVGTVETGYDGVHVSYNNAALATDRAFFFRPNELVYYYPAGDQPEFDSAEAIKSFGEALEEEKFDAVRWLAENIKMQLCSNKSMTSATAKNIYYRLTETINLFLKNHFMVYAPEHDAYNMLSKIMDAQFVSELHEHLMTELNNAEQIAEKTNFNGAVRSAVIYIEKNFADSCMSILDIAQHCNVSVNYLCGQFKAVIGKTINNYVNDLRISQAKKLIIETNKHINEISGLCGFNDAKYFCKVFNKYTGMTPVKFRGKYR